MISTGPLAHLRLLGGATLEGQDGPISGRGAQRRRIALLAILAGTRRAVSRDKIVGLLWEESDSEKARKLLSESLYVIRKAISENALITTGDDIRLNPDVVRCDIVDFHDALDAGDDAAAVALYSGPFLDGFFISDAPEFEKWVDTTRDMTARAYADALARLAKTADAEGDGTEAVRWWRKLTEHDPYNAAHAIGLMNALDRTGQRAAALQHARTHASLLRSEFDADPDQNVEALARQIKDAPAPRIEVTPRVDATPRIDPTPRTDAPPAPEPTRRARSFPWRRIAALCIAIAIVAVIGISIRNNTQPTASKSGALIAVFPFAVRGATTAADDSVSILHDGMVDLLSTNLDGAGDLRTVDPHALLSYIGNISEISTRDASSLAHHFGADLYVLGDVTQAASQMQLNATMYDAKDGRVVQHATVRGSADSLFILVDQLAAQLVATRGVELDDLTRLAALTNTSYVAFKAYLEGESHYHAGRYDEAVSSFTRAITEDPKFALAHYRLSAAAEWSFDFELARRAARDALDNSDRLPDRFSPLLRAWMYFLNGNAREGRLEYERILTNYPDNVEARAGLGEVLLHFNPPQGLPSDAARDAFNRVLSVAAAFGEVRFHAMEFAARDGNVARFDSLLSAIEPRNHQYLAWHAVRAFTWGTPAEQNTVMRALSRANELEIGLAVGRLAAHTHNFAAARRVAGQLTRAGRVSQWQAAGHLITAELWLGDDHAAEAERELAMASRLEQDWSMELATLLVLSPARNATANDLRAQQAALLAWDPGSHMPSTTFFFAAHALQHARLRDYLLGLIAARLGALDEAEQYRRSIEHESGDAEGVAFGVALSKSLAGHIARARGDREQALQLLTAATIDAPPEFLALSPFYSRAYDRLVMGDLNAELKRPAEARRWYQSLLEGYDFMYVAVAKQRLTQIR